MKFMYNVSVKGGSEESIEMTILFFQFENCICLVSFCEGMYYVGVREQSAEAIYLLPC